MSNNRTALSLATRNGRLLKRPAASRMGLAEIPSSTVWRAGRGGYAPSGIAAAPRTATRSSHGYLQNTARSVRPASRYGLALNSLNGVNQGRQPVRHVQSRRFARQDVIAQGA